MLLYKNMDIWKHGKYIDMWSLVHFLSGYNLFLLFFSLGYEFIHAMVFSLILLLAWEIFEWVTKIIEPSLNVMADIVVGFLGFLFAGYLHNILNLSFSYLYFGIILGVTITLSVWGFLDFLKRGYR